MRADEVRTLFEYNYWANKRLQEVAAKAPPDELTRARGMNCQSVLGTLVHILDAEWSWRVGCQTGAWPEEDLSVQTIPDLAALGARWGQDAGEMRTFLAGLTDEDVGAARTFRSGPDREREWPLWQVLVHVVNHGTQHRAEAADRLTQLGQSPGSLDFIRFVSTRDR
ncbi:MAG: DinB family protein [Chloroflexi bacterium]|nr:DinB family protein [Chloroflexota bacterium]